MFEQSGKTPLTLFILTAACLFISGCSDNDPSSFETQSPIEILKILEPNIGEFPEDSELNSEGDWLYASYFPANLVAILDAEDLSLITTSDIVAPTGLARSNDGSEDMFVATAPWFQGLITGIDNTSEHSLQGVWRVSGTGATEQVASLEIENVLPNGIAIDQNQNIYVSNLIGDQIYRIDESGNVSLWLQDERLSGDSSIDELSPSPGFSLGINGLRIKGNSLFMANTDRGQVLQVDIMDDGSAGTISIFRQAQDLIGIDGFDIDDNDRLYASNLLTDSILQVNTNEDIRLLASFDDGVAAPTGTSLNSSSNPESLYFNNFSVPVFPFLSSDSVSKPAVGRINL